MIFSLVPALILISLLGHFDMFAGNPDFELSLKSQLAFLAKHTVKAKL